MLAACTAQEILIIGTVETSEALHFILNSMAVYNICIYAKEQSFYRIDIGLLHASKHIPVRGTVGFSSILDVQ